MKLAPNYYTDQFNKLGFQSESDLKKDETVKIKLCNDISESNYISIDSIALLDIYKIIQNMNERSKNK